MSATNIRIPALGGDGEIPAYVARPDADSSRAIIIIPEIFGVNAGIREKCDDWAAQGYLAIAPDLFWRFAPGVELDPDIEAEMNEALRLLGLYDTDDGVRDIEAAIRWLHGQGATKVGCAGYCLGGKLAYMTAARTDIDVSVGYYGVMIDQMLNESHAIARPLMLHIPTADHFVSPEAQAKMHEALDPHPKVTLHDYVGLDHGFAATSGDRRDEAAAQLADSRTRAFLAEHLA
ncbi:MAG: carboxymethylenebutenolidase [Sphingopyxis sp.]|nr:carboxymethylenebutenolidase [Sphingopyxis sp.]